MRKLIRYELYKLFSQRLTVFILAVLLALNGILIYHTAVQPLSQNTSVSRVDVAKAYTFYEGQSTQEITEEISVWMEAYQGLWYLDEEGVFHQPTEEQIQELLRFTDRIGSDAYIRNQILSQVEALAGYTAYLDTVQETAEKLSQSSLFSNPNSYSHRNLIKTAERYLPLYDVEVTPGDSSGVKLALEGHTTTVLLLFGMVLIVLNLTLTEREEGLLLLVKPTANGRGSMIGAKLVTMLLCLLFLTAAFYGMNLAISASLFGLGDLSLSIQSLDGYLTSPWQINVGQYISLYFGAKYLGAATVGMVFFLICILTKNRIAACVLGAAVLMVEVGLYVLIPMHSWLSVLRQMNLAAILNTAEFFSDYLTLNVFSFPVSIGVCSALACGLVLAGGSVLACRRWCREETVEPVRNRKSRRFGSRVSTNLLGHEAYKLLVTCKGGVLLIVLLLVQVFSYSGMTAYALESEVWYQYYAELLAGDYSEENAAFLAEEQAFFDSVYLQQQEYYAMADRGEISLGYASFLASKIQPSSSREEGFYRAKAQYDYLQTQHDAGKQVQFVSTTGYDFLLDDLQSDVMDAAKLGFVLAVCFSIYFTMEDTSGMMRLILPSPVGKQAVTRRKLTVCAVYLLLACGAAFLPRIVASLNIYPMVSPESAAASLQQFQNAPEGFSILGYFLLVNLSRVLGALLATLGILWVCGKVKQPIGALVVCLIELELPVFLYLLGIIDEVVLLPMMTGHWLMN